MHGVDLAHFGQPACESLAVMKSIPAPRIGYFGLFDGRSDQALLETLADSMPETSIVIAGHTEGTFSALRARDNVNFLGPLPYADLPALVAGLDALILPYKVDRLSEALSPLKLKEYLATGLPVISTPIAAALELDDYLMIESTAESWRSTLLEVLNDSEKRDQTPVRRFLETESWERKAEEFVYFCLDKGARQGSGA